MTNCTDKKGLNGTYGEQNDGSVVDKNGLIITPEERVELDRQVYSLPIYQDTIRDDIMYHLKKGEDLIIDGSTGSGKSTGTPIFAREATGKKVVQTVPRVLAAMSLAERISKILLAQTGNADYTLGYNEVGYRTGAGVSSERLSSLSTHTDGLEMMRMLYSGLNSGVLIVDEVQNKSIATEIILFIAKYQLDIQLIIMSATLNTDIYQQYMASRGKAMPIVKIPGRTFPIEEHYYGSSGVINKTIELAKAGKHTLHIVSGKSRIEDVVVELQKELGYGYEIIPLHAELSKEEQFATIIPPEDSNVTRIIVATNVAEESITIPYLNAVVDEGLHKVGRINHEGNPELRIEPITLANTKQRMGRVGRTQIGEYHRFNDTSVDDLHEYPEAAIENSRLEREILLFAKSGKDFSGIVNRAKSRGEEAFLHTVDTNLLEIGYERLEQIGAIDNFGNITQLGEDLLSISLEPSHARMIIEGVQRDCTEEMILVTSILSVNGFLSKDGNWKEIKNGEKKKTDFLTYLDLYDFVTKKHLSEDVAARLVFLGVDREEMLAFQESDQSKCLFEMVKLDPLGIKDHKVSQIHNKAALLRKSLRSGGVEISEDKKISGRQIKIRSNETKRDIVEDITICIAAGYPFYVYKYDEKTGMFEHASKCRRKTKESFKQASISRVTPSHRKLYVGEPFIIGPNELAMQGEVEHYFDQSEPIQGDLCILSHISEIEESALKMASETQRGYTSIFTQKFTSKKEKGKKAYESIEDIEAAYNSLVEEMFSGSFSHRKFLQYALPLFLMAKNNRFVKFLQGKPINTVHGMEQRLRKFFIHREADYIDRISNSITDIERSFKDDSYVYDDFRDFEQAHQSELKRQRRRGKNISRKDREDIEEKALRAEEERAFAKEVGLLQGGRFDIDFSDIEGKVRGQYIVSMITQGGTYNTLVNIYEDEFSGKDVTRKQDEIRNTREAENQKSALRSMKTRIRELKKNIETIDSLLTFLEKPNGTYGTIDFDEANNALRSDKNKKLFSRSQIKKYHNSVAAIHTIHHDTSGSQRILKMQKRTKSALEGIKTQLEKEQENEKTRLENEKINIEARKQGSLQTRKELHFFFSALYEPEYFNTVINEKISTILIEVIESGDIASVIEDWIMKFNIAQLKKLSRAKGIHNFLTKRKAYMDLYSGAMKKIGTYEKNKESLQTDQIGAFTRDLASIRKQLSDIKSLICSLP